MRPFRFLITLPLFAEITYFDRDNLVGGTSSFVAL